MPPIVDVDRLGTLVSAIGSPLFGSHYFKLFREVLRIDQCTVFSFSEQRADSIVLEVGNPRMRQMAHELATEYVSGSFTEDPNVRQMAPTEDISVHSLCAQQLSNRAYRRRFYDQPCLSHELVILGRAQGVLYYSSFYRGDPRAPYRGAEIEAVAPVAGFLIKALHRHRELIGPAVGVGSRAAGEPKLCRRETAAHLRDVLLAEAFGLSPREAQVCAGIILGYTTLGISLNFGISINTVATHRKRAYRKLGISSQNELFARYFHIVNQLGPQVVRTR